MKTQIDLLEEGESLEKAFQLAYLLVQDRPSAIGIVISALDKLSVQCRREKRRFYWRYHRAHQPIRRITRHQLDALQWLIMFESETYERVQEQRGSPSARHMVIRYIKHLVQVTTAMSSFYVCVGMNRLLYCYSTSETQAAYEMVAQRFPGADQYRRAKKLLTTRLTERFGEFVETIKADYGELRFKSLEDQSPWLELVRDCLTTFSPWSTEQLCESFRAKVSDIRTGVLPVDGTAEPDTQETICCHVFIEPVCRESLLAALAFSPPEARLALPRFAMKEGKEGTGGNDSSGSQGQRTSKLSAEESALITEHLASSKARRQKVSPASVRVVVDGVERSHFGLTGSGQLQIELAEGAKLIEMWGEDEHGKFLFGAHLISYAGEPFEFSEALLPLNNGRLLLTISPIVACDDQARAVLTLTFKRRLQMSSISWNAFAAAWRPIRSYVLTGAATALIAWTVTDALYTHRMDLLRQSQRPTPEVTPRESVSPVASYVLIPDSTRVRTASGSDIPTISLSSRPGVVILELPVSFKPQVSYRAALKEFTGNRELLVENSIRSRQTTAGQTVSVTVPAALLTPDTYYQVKIDSISPNGQRQEVDRFTFRCVE